MALHTAISKDELNLHLAKTCIDLKNTVKRGEQIAERLNILFVLNTQ